MNYVLSIDQGTTGTRAVIFDGTGTVIRDAYREFTQYYPRPGWVEHDPAEIWDTVRTTVTDVLDGFSGTIDCAGITNQRETTILWDRATGKPLYNAIVWQCRRTAQMCREYTVHAPLIRDKTGLPVDAYFSATKIRWILDHIDRAPSGDIAFGTIDSWLLWNLTGGRVHVTDYTNASRTLLFNIHELTWDSGLLDMFDIPRDILPETRPSAGEFGVISALPELNGIPLTGIAGDQQAALFGQACFNPGQTKNTYGTGAFVVMNTGTEAVIEPSLVTTRAVDGAGNPCFALEGSIFVAGAAVQWLRDELGIIDSAPDTDEIAASLEDNGGVYFVPALTGLGAPYWDMEARGTITGLTRGTGAAHIVRATLESMAYQTADVIDVMNRITSAPLPRLMVDGGAAGNDFLMQFQADVLGVEVARPTSMESTALGAAMLAGRATGLWSTAEELASIQTIDRVFSPRMDNDKRESLRTGWREALYRTTTT